jgi:hypothetical protein
MGMNSGRKIKDRFALQKIKAPELSSVLAYAASFMLTGVPPVVCESVLNEVYNSVKKSIASILH